MDIRFVSTLTSEDEDDLAPAILKAATSILDRFSLPYTLRIETTAQTVYQYHHPAVDRRPVPDGADADLSERRPRRVATPQC